MASISGATDSRILSDRLRVGDEGKRRKRKVKESKVAETSSKRSRTSLRARNSKMTNQALCHTEGGISAFTRIETGRTNQQRVLQEITSGDNIPLDLSLKSKAATNFTFSNYFLPVVRNMSPLPELSWADSWEVWSYMLEKDIKYTKDHLYLRQHSNLQPRMRAILLDWLIEVCEVYRLHRESYFLAVDFVDRYLSAKTDIPKQRLQLVGTTALFIASKLEEIYPPKLSEFAYVTDGACTEEEIIQQELLMLKDLQWTLTPVTSNAWLNIYLQLHWLSSENTKQDVSDSKKFNFVIPKYSQQEFVRVALLLDICSLDIGSLQFSYSVLAASAVYHMLPVNIEDITGHKWDELFACIQWMRPFAATIQEQEVPALKTFEQVKPEDAHNIQTHIVDLSMLELALARKDSYPSYESPVNSTVTSYFTPLTPPSSTKK